MIARRLKFLFVLVLLCAGYMTLRHNRFLQTNKRINSTKSRSVQFNHLCGPSSQCSATRKSLAKAFLGRKSENVTLAYIKMCVDFQPENGLCFLPMHYGDGQYARQAGMPLPDIFKDMISNDTVRFAPSENTSLNYLPRAITFFTDISSKLPLHAAGTAIFVMNDTANADLTQSDIAAMKTNGSPFLAHTLQRSEVSDEFVTIPDYHFSTARGYSFVLSQQARLYQSLEERENKVFWRGNPNGPKTACLNGKSCNTCDRCALIPRVKLVRQALSIPGADIKLVKQLGVCKNCDMDWQNRSVMGRPLSETKWGKYRVLLDIAGKSDAWGAFKRYRSGSVVLRVENDWIHWYDHRLKPWVHYIPVRPDLSDLSAQVAFATSEKPEDIAKLKKIASSAEEALRNISYDGEVARVAKEIADIWKNANLSSP